MNKNITLTTFIQEDTLIRKNIPKKIILELLELGKIENIEAGIVKHFLEGYKIKTNNKFISNLIQSSETDIIIWFLKKNEVILGIEDIEKIFELLVPPEDKELNGAVYTPNFIVNYIVDNIVDKLGTICDCSCGSGSFLLGAVKRLKKISNKPIIELIENYIYGVDILDYSIRRTKIILSLYAICHNEDKEDIKFNLEVADALESDWVKLFPYIFFKYRGFDYVIGNPPYVRIQDLPQKLRQSLTKSWGTIKIGSYNLYFAFFELGIRILNSTGKLGYITPNNYFTSLSGIELREFFGKQKQITRILNFNHLRLFENAQTYTCITLMQKNYDKEYFEYYYLEDKKEIENGLNQIQFSKYYYKWLNNKKWRLMTEKDYENVKKIENIGTHLGKLCHIRVGIATLKDTIYFVWDCDKLYCNAEFKGKNYLIEKDITRKIIKISSINNEKEVFYNKRRILFPYVKENGKYKIMPEQYLKNNYPLCYKYLLDAKEELSKRDKGKSVYPFWFAWGRTQGMDYRGKRLYTRTFYDRPDFMLDEDNLFCNGYAVFCRKHIREIQKILNSRVMEYYIKKTSVEIEGNYQCYQKNFIEKFGIPELKDEDWRYLENEADKNKIDNWLIKKYDLKL